MTSSERLRQLAAADEPRARIMDSLFVMPGPGVTEVLLIRHGHVPAGPTSQDAPLSDLGHEQAEELAGFLHDLPIAAIYASPAQRTRQTAEPLARRLGLTVQLHEGLRDIENHMPDGLNPQEALVQRFGEEEGGRRFALLQTGGWRLDHFGGLLEASERLRSRARDSVQAAIDAHSGERIAVFSHGPVIMSYVAELLATPADFFYMPSLTSISAVLARDGRRMLRVLNATPHFGVL